MLLDLSNHMTKPRPTSLNSAEILRATTRYRYLKARWSARKARRYKTNVLPLAELGKIHLVAPDGTVYFRARSGAPLPV